MSWIRTHKSTLVVKGTDGTGSCKFNYHIIMTTTAPHKELVLVSILTKIPEFNSTFSPYEIKFVSDLWKVQSFSSELRFLQPIKLTTTI